MNEAIKNNLTLEEYMKYVADGMTKDKIEQFMYETTVLLKETEEITKEALILLGGIRNAIDEIKSGLEKQIRENPDIEDIIQPIIEDYETLDDDLLELEGMIEDTKQ